MRVKMWEKIREKNVWEKRQKHAGEKTIDTQNMRYNKFAKIKTDDIYKTCE